MFDPELWRRTRLSAISLIAIGAVLLLPAGYVFYLAILLMDLTGAEMMQARSKEAILFWTALIGSSTGVLAWMSLCFLLVQRRDIRVHRLAWHLIRAAGVVIVLCLAAWIWLIMVDRVFDFSAGDAPILLIVLCAIMAAALLLIWLGQRNLGFVRSAARRAVGAKFPDSERISEPTP